MKIKHATFIALAAVPLLLGSCIYSSIDGYGNYTYETNYQTKESWSKSSYDGNGFPIFGYCYGRPVYGYTYEGAALYTFAGLAAGCYVPHWEPAPWYHGSWVYPGGLHHVGAPPHFPRGHRPSHRPHGGMNAPIHRNPRGYFGGHGGHGPHGGPGHHGGPRH